MARALIESFVLLLICLLMITIFFALTGCSALNIGSSKVYKTEEVGFHGRLDAPVDKCGTACGQLLQVMGEVKACMEVEEPIAPPEVVIYKCPAKEGENAECLILCDIAWDNSCYNSWTKVLSLSDKRVDMQLLRQHFVKYISGQIGTFNAAYLKECKGSE